VHASDSQTAGQLELSRHPKFCNVVAGETMMTFSWRRY
jgi:hypothetical protein